MKVIVKISEFFGKYMALIVLAVAALALFVPQSSLWIDTSWVNYLLMIVMFGMGLTMKPKDFALIIKRPKDILIGCAAQFIIMPALAFGLSKLFQLDPALTAGVVLVGTCPGGTSSNVMTYLSKGDVALSVGMTSVNTLLAPLLTPAITWLLLQTTVKVDVWSMFWSIIQVIIIPIALGFVINRFFGKITQKAVAVLPMISTIAICLIIATVVSHNAEKIYTSGVLVMVVVVLHNLLGYACGFGLGKLLRFRTQGLPPALPERRSPISPWQRYPARSFRYGTTSPVRFWRRFTENGNNKINRSLHREMLFQAFPDSFKQNKIFGR